MSPSVRDGLRLLAVLLQGGVQRPNFATTLLGRTRLLTTTWYAHGRTVTVATFLSLFIGKVLEIQASQSLKDGNIDAQWKRGAVLIAKEEGLRGPTDKISPEDVVHIRNRVRELEITEVIAGLKDVESCAPCMARWVRDGAATHDERSRLSTVQGEIAPDSAGCR